MEMGEKIKTLRKQKGMTLEELGDLIGVGKSTVRKWENGMIANMRRDKIAAVAKALNVSPMYLMGWEPPKTSQAVRIPVYSRVAAGIPLEASGEVVDYEEIPEALSRSGEYFGLRVVGDSMEPKISDGDTIIVRKQETAEPGEVIVATVNGSDACVKRLKTFEGGIMLISTNPAYEPITYTQEEVERLPVRIIGKVVELRAKF